MKLSFTLAITLLFSAFVLTTNAQDAIPRFQKHEVQEGETATSIAKSFNVDLQSFCLLNDFPESVTLTEGQIVLIRQLEPGEMEVQENLPAKKERKIVRTDDAISYEKPAEKTTESKPAAKPAEAKSTAKPAASEEKAIVKKETAPVAKSAPVESAPAKTAFVDEKPGITPASTKAVEIGPGGTKYNVTKGEYHVVAKGQTFFRIALIYGLTVEELKEINGLTSTTVEIGQRLKVRK
ncbi:MAG: LysM domain [Bacteroidota bacterium]|jgi:LysM repeat protein